jgi:Domain of unknown function (DUF4386)
MAVAPAVNASSSAEPGSRMTYSRLIGALFLLGFVLYGGGLGLATSVVGARDFLSTISAHQTTLVIGALLMLLNSVVVLTIGVLIFPILENHSKRTAVGYLACRIGEAVFLALGVLALLMTIPLAEQSVQAGAVNADWAKALGSVAVQSNSMAYQIAVISLGVGSTFLCWLLFRTRLVPRFLAVLGLVGYAIYLAGAIAEISGTHIGVILSIPGGLFEVGFALWLIVKGFQPEAYRGQPVMESAA